jgi:hypothetical protein
MGRGWFFPWRAVFRRRESKFRGRLPLGITRGPRGRQDGNALNGHVQDGLTGPDLITVFEVARLDPGAVEVSAVAAAHVHQLAARRVHLDQEVHPREITVFQWQLEMGALRPAHKKQVMAGEREFPALVGPGSNG